MSRDLRLLILALFTWGIGEGMFIFFQPIALRSWGASPVLIGVIYGLAGFANVVVQLPVGYITDRIGPRAPMVGSWIVGVVGAVIMAAANSLTVFAAGVVVYGFSMFVLTPLNKYATNARGSWSPQRALTTASAAFNLGAVIGPLVGGWIGERYSLPAIYAAAVVILVISTAIILSTSHQPPIPSSSAEGRKKIAIPDKRTAFRLSLVFLTFFSLYIAQPLAPSFLEEVHSFDLEKIGGLGSISSLGNTLILLLFGGVNPFLGILAGQLLVGGFAAAFWLGQSWFVFAAGYFLLGGYRLTRSMMVAYTMPLVPPEEIGVTYGFIETMTAIAIILAPPIAGLIYNIQPSLVFLTALVLVLISFLLNYSILPVLAIKKPPAPLQEPLEINQ